MAGQAPRSIINIVFILCLVGFLGVAGFLTWDMFQDALSGPTVGR